MATSERKGGERRFGWLGSGGPPRLASLIESHVVSRFKFPARKAAAEKKGVKEIGEGGRKEPKSGMSFPGSVCLVGDRGSCVDLTGVGGEARPGGRNSYLDRADARALTLLTRAASALPRSPRRSSKSARRGSRASPALPPTRLGSTSTTRTLPGSPKVGPTLSLSLSLVSPFLRGSDLPAPASSGEGTPQQLLKSVVSQPAKTSCIRLVVVFPRATPKAIAKSLGKAFSSSSCSSRLSH